MRSYLRVTSSYSFNKFVDSKFPCFVKPKTLVDEIKDRISLKYNTGINGEKDYFELVERLVKSSANNFRTG